MRELGGREQTDFHFFLFLCFLPSLFFSLSLCSFLYSKAKTMTITVGDVEAAISKAVDKVVEYGKVRARGGGQKERESVVVVDV